MDLDSKGECSFTDLMHAHDVDTGKLSFHMRSLQPFTEQTTTGKYKLNKAGQDAIKFIKDVEFWAEEAEISNKNSSLLLAPFSKRTYAFLIDFLLIFAFTTGSMLSLNLNSTLLITLILLFVYSTLFEGFNGQTLGKKALGLKVVRIDGKPIFYDYAAMRNFGKAFLLPFDLVLGWRLQDNRFIRYFDKIAGTTVIDVRA